MVRIAQMEPSGRMVLGCAGCGEDPTLDDRLEDEELATREFGEPLGGAGGP